MKDKIDFDEFLSLEKKLEVKVGVVLSVEEVPKADKLLKLQVSFGPGDQRMVVTNIKPHLGNPQGLEGYSFLFVTNLKPTMIRGIESHAMILPGPVEQGGIVRVNGEPGVNVL